MVKKITFLLNKLVRDKVYDNMVEVGQEIDSFEIEAENMQRQLLDKFTEELEELKSGDDDSPVDLGSVLFAYARLKGTSESTLLEEIHKRDEKRGAFEYRRFVKTVTLEADDPWVEYYRKDPERFKEFTNGN